ncbi:hypothetical protein TRVA0_025S00804 [Trichomonascus vanleenenianus]|uniref:uncharacterized protein n=1 Tax=Trichomonascus vanleenenianus TaxID=2268995 RepID=UPI003ECB3AE8
MVYQEDFKVERWMDDYETKVDVNIAETCCYSLTLEEISKIIDKPIPTNEIANKRLVYGAITGSNELKDGITDMINSTSSGPITIGRDDVVITNGAIGANFLCYYSIVGKGDHVIVVDPAYQQLNSVPKMFGGDVELLPLVEENNYLPDLDRLREMVRKGQTKLININSPHNPSGAVFAQKLLLEIVDIAREADCYLLCDEVYRPLYHSLDEGEETPSSVATLYEKGVITGSMSKAFNAAGLRLGWVATPNKELMRDLQSKRDYNTISVGMIDDFFAAWIMSGWRELIKYNFDFARKNIAILDEFVASSNGIVSYVKPRGGSTCLLKLNTVPNSEEFAKKLAVEEKTLVVPGESFNLPGFLRIGFVNSTNELIEGLEILKQKIKKLGYIPEGKTWN